ncbi:TIGR03668 family PPOX class F420-dependent oxidoreductase [Streptomyces sp. NPDC049881]|uniref:TIGR03668 family PPOX class F420-dependent oxidoreductase n=1 Tax=Streptomyces sp. NPDC049881 TaxID=3155778 RepID=UPI0034121093
MQLTEKEARRRLTEAAVARLATVDEAGRPHLVPVTFAAVGDTVAIAIDHKPKRHRDLKRLRNITANPLVCLLADRYDDDWSQLWWARADGSAHVLDIATCPDEAEWLLSKYSQYRDQPPEGPVIRIEVTRWTGWAYAHQTPPEE